MKRYKLFVKIINSENLMYKIVAIVGNTVLYN